MLETKTQTLGVLAQNPELYTVEDLAKIRRQALEAGRRAAVDYIQTYGEDSYCGFAWVNIHGVRGNTRLGRRMKEAGFDKDYSGAYSLWDPSGLGTQSMSVKEAAARATAEVFTQYGFRAYAGSRAD